MNKRSLDRERKNKNCNFKFNFIKIKKKIAFFVESYLRKGKMKKNKNNEKR